MQQAQQQSSTKPHKGTLLPSHVGHLQSQDILTPKLRQSSLTSRKKLRRSLPNQSYEASNSLSKSSRNSQTQ